MFVCEATLKKKKGKLSGTRGVIPVSLFGNEYHQTSEFYIIFIIFINNGYRHRHDHYYRYKHYKRVKRKEKHTHTNKVAHYTSLFCLCLYREKSILILVCLHSGTSYMYNNVSLLLLMLFLPYYQFNIFLKQKYGEKKSKCADQRYRKYLFLQCLRTSCYRKKEWLT